MKYDDIMVGAGSFGGIEAALASKDRKRNVLLIEAGPDSRTTPTIQSRKWQIWYSRFETR
ncbi:MAG TPA: hypothetical protein VND20_07290 [Candidatus Binataceae bacterium]|nr:hypothetical protein [Candidatus Binataceae bacterium]